MLPEPDNRPMHLLIPHASALSPACAHTLSHLALPQLSRLLGRLQATPPDTADEYTLSPPHERALGRCLGLSGEDGALPWAALAAQADGLLDQADTGEGPAPVWGLMSPVHWQVGREHVTLSNPEALQLDEDDSRAAFEAVRGLFESEGFGIHWGAPLRWYLTHPSLAGLPCASIDRVIGRNVDLWLQTDTQRFPQARLIRRLQNEVQMLLYTHPVTDQREAHGQQPVNSFWLSGCGRLQRPTTRTEPQVQTALRSPLLAEDWAAWAEAWQLLDAGPLAELLAHAERGEPVRLTLCGERTAQTYETQPRSLWQRLSGRWHTTDTAKVLEAL